ncbi:MAG: hypothetical protein ABIT16_00285 [Croceibacterium sp.]
MKKTILVIALASLGACNQAAPDTAATTDPNVEASVNTADAGFEAVAPGNYDIVHADGKVDKLVVHPGLTWSMVAADNSPSGGTIFNQDGKVCFVTEGVDGHRCFAGEPPADDGSIAVTGDDGSKATVKPTAA